MHFDSPEPPPMSESEYREEHCDHAARLECEYSARILEGEIFAQKKRLLEKCPSLKSSIEDHFSQLYDIIEEIEKAAQSAVDVPDLRRLTERERRKMAMEEKANEL